MIEVYYLEVIL